MTILEARDILLKIPNPCYSLDPNDLPDEQWRDVIGYEGLYQVSNYGRAKSSYSGKWRILKPIRRADGYVDFGLHKNGSTRHRPIHILVAQTFIPNPENKPIVNHIDGDKTNNRVDNLEWATNSENVIHAHERGLIHVSKGTTHYRAQLTHDEVRYIREHHIPYHPEFSATALGKKFNVHLQVIIDVVNRRTYRDVE